VFDDFNWWGIDPFRLKHLVSFRRSFAWASFYSGHAGREASSAATQIAREIQSKIGAFDPH
jgi:hypothetical protein